MQYVIGLLGGMLAVFSVLCQYDSNAQLWMSVYALGSVLAFVTLLPHIGLHTARMLAFVTTLSMFFYFAGFFQMAPALKADWYVQGHARSAISLLFSGFAMIPVLSHYSGRMKEICPLQRKARRKLERQMRGVERAQRQARHQARHIG